MFKMSTIEGCPLSGAHCMHVFTSLPTGDESFGKPFVKLCMLSAIVRSKHANIKLSALRKNARSRRYVPIPSWNIVLHLVASLLPRPSLLFYS